MKILQIAPAWVATPPKDYGGTEWVIANLIKGLAVLGQDVTIFATKDSQAEGKVRYTFEKSLLDEGISWTAALPALIHYHQAFKEAAKFDLVHAHLSSETDLILLPLLADLTDRGIPNILTIHSRWPFDRYSNMDEKFLDLYGDKILAVNISMVMQNTLPKQLRDGGFVYNSLDLTKMQFNPRGGNYLTWLGKIIPEKGTAEAIKAAKMAGQQLIFAGIIDRYHEKSVRYWIKDVKPLIDGRQIQYLGPADLRLKNKLLGEARAFLNPIDWEEPFGMVMVESMACGTPVISYDRGAAREIIEHGETGFLVESNIREMVQALGRIDQIDRVKCREHIEDHFTPEIAARKYLKLYAKQLLYQKLRERKNGYGVSRLVPAGFPLILEKTQATHLKW